MFSAVVFAYSEVGFRCLNALLDGGVHVRQVFTHEDAPGERPWFGSVARLAAERGVEVCTASPHAEASLQRVAALAPEYLLSFYYRALLEERLLACARWAALNMHGSLLPKFRGRAPINWAIVKGETQTGATLHYMVRKPDAGPIVAQERVAIGIDDTAHAVSLAVAAAAARMLARSLPRLAAGPPPGRAMDLSHGSYFGGRTPEDGRIDWTQPAAAVHNLIRAVAPPFPGAFTDLAGRRWLFAGSHWTGEAARHPGSAPCLYLEERRLLLDCRDGLRLAIPGVVLDGRELDAESFGRLFAPALVALDPLHPQGAIPHEEAAHPRC
ncbi:MAG TPA: formyltransferase [Steroidobacteraceae bacterium]|nr:formyltransferase [Steroidobacteraceae bacterium]